MARIAAETVGGLGLAVELDGLGAPRRTGTEVSGDWALNKVFADCMVLSALCSNLGPKRLQNLKSMFRDSTLPALVLDRCRRHWTGDR